MKLAHPANLLRGGGPAAGRLAAAVVADMSMLMVTNELSHGEALSNPQLSMQISRRFCLIPS